MDTFDFQEALSYIKAGMVVGLTIDGKERRYYLNQFWRHKVCSKW